MEQGRAFITVEKVLRMQTIRFQGWLGKSARSLRVPLIKSRWRFERDADTTHGSWFPAASPDPLKCCGDTQEAVRFRFTDIAEVKLPDAADAATKNPTWATSPRANFVQSAEEFKQLVADNHALHRRSPTGPLRRAFTELVVTLVGGYQTADARTKDAMLTALLGLPRLVCRRFCQ